MLPVYALHRSGSVYLEKYGIHDIQAKTQNTTNIQIVTGNEHLLLNSISESIVQTNNWFQIEEILPRKI